MKTRYILLLPAVALLATGCLKTDSNTTGGLTEAWVGSVQLESTQTYVNDFAQGIAADEVAANVLDYQTDANTPAELRTRLEDQNQHMADMGFGDFSNAAVHRASSGNIFYAVYAGTNGQGERDMCLAVIDPNSQSEEPIAILEGPVTTCLGIATEHLEGEELTPEEVEQVLVPLRPGTQGFGDFDEGMTTERYETAGGTVSVSYSNRGEGTGFAIFKAEGCFAGSDCERTYDLTGEWTLNY